MTLIDRIAIIPPPPSQEISTYKPFPDEVERIFDEILSEEASFLSGEGEWDMPGVSAGSESLSGASIHSPLASSHKHFVSSPHLPTSKSTPTSTKQDTGQTHLQSQSRPVPKNIEVIEILSDTEAYESMVDQSVVQGKSSKMGKIKGNRRNGQSADQGDAQPEPASADHAEEGVIFASVDISARQKILDFVVSHQFLAQPTQPVRKSTRRRFTRDVRREAISHGMPDEAIYGLIHYVRRIYLDLAGVDAGTLSEYADDITFGDEFDDSPERKSCTKSRKRGLRSSDVTEEVAPKKQKQHKRRSRQSDVSEQPLLPDETYHTPPDLPKQRTPEKKHDTTDDLTDGKLPDLPVTSSGRSRRMSNEATLGSGSIDDSKLLNANKVQPQSTPQKIQGNESCAGKSPSMCKEKARATPSRVEDKNITPELHPQKLNGSPASPHSNSESSPTPKRRSSLKASNHTVKANQPSERLPTQSLHARSSSITATTNPTTNPLPRSPGSVERKKDPVRRHSTDASWSFQNTVHNNLKITYGTPPGKPAFLRSPTVAGSGRILSQSSPKAKQNENQRRHSTGAPQTQTQNDAGAVSTFPRTPPSATRKKEKHIVRRSADLALVESDPNEGDTEVSVPNPKKPSDKKTRRKSQNKRKRENKMHRRNKRKSQASTNVAEIPSTPARSTVEVQVPSTPASKQSKGSGSRSRYGPLSPNPAEWDMDF
ncbi:hypothetical protein N7456_007717 [Penicillium angulare]|uniref:Uncharacterized protein n=1 Tax=Penicillium angulare TaxID=116970 RepID=A0A9W9FB45_9EURO|nr:hypothetical protein N7456_007717 [Penicillium angulare]